jgi:hypothetical protein
LLLSNISEPVSGTIPFQGPLLSAASFETSDIGATSLFWVTALLDIGSPNTPVFAELRIDEDNRPGALVTEYGTVIRSPPGALVQ